MNELIKELLARAHLESPSLHDTNWIANRFAELIIKECANFIDSHEQVDKYGEAYEIVTGNDLRKHFGVEE